MDLERWTRDARELIVDGVPPLIDDERIDMWDSLASDSLELDMDADRFLQEVLQHNPQHLAERFATLNYLLRLSKTTLIPRPETDGEIEEIRQKVRELLKTHVTLPAVRIVRMNPLSPGPSQSRGAWRGPQRLAPAAGAGWS